MTGPPSVDGESSMGSKKIPEKQWRRWEEDVRERPPLPELPPGGFDFKRSEKGVNEAMLNNLKKYAGMHLALLVAILGVVAQAGHQYLTAHPTVTMGGFFGACGLALVNFFLTAPKDSNL